MIPTMDIYSKPGTKVVYAHPKNGLPAHSAHARLHLTEGETYTVKTVRVGSWCTSVEFEEAPKLWFNSVLFAPYGE